MTAEHNFDHRKLSKRILAALGIGFLFGLALNATASESEFVRDWLEGGLLRVAGDVFVRLLSMLVVPIVFVSLVNGVSSLSDPRRLGRIGGLTIGLYTITTGIAVVLALAASSIFRPGAGAAPEAVAPGAIAAAPSFVQVLIDMVPRNPVEAMAQGNMLPIIVFSVLLGLAISFAGRGGAKVAELFEQLNTVVMRLVGIVMTMAPYGVFALIARMAATTGWETFAGVLDGPVIIAHGCGILGRTGPSPACSNMCSWCFWFSSCTRAWCTRRCCAD